MKKKASLLKELKENKKGEAFLSFILISPLIVWFFMYLVLGGVYFAKSNQMANIVNSKLDMALVEGKFTNQMIEDIKDDLSVLGFTKENIEISIFPEEANPAGDEYAERGQEMIIQVICKDPQPFYYINRFIMPTLKPESLYIGTKLAGMSEKW